MDLSFFALSGENIATLKASPSETVFELKQQLRKSTDSAPIFELQILLDGVCLDDATRLHDLNVGTSASLQVIRLQRSAREMLFDPQEVVMELAKHYDSLQGQCKEHIGSLFLAENGGDQSRRVKMEVLLALQQKLQGATCESELPWLKTALADVALDLLRDDQDDALDLLPAGLGRMNGPACPKPNSRHIISLIRCFPWFGLEAVQRLLERFPTNQNFQSHLVLYYRTCPRVKVKELLCQVSSLEECSEHHDMLTPWAKLKNILLEADDAIKKRLNMTQENISDVPSVRPACAQKHPKRAPLETPKEVIAVARRCHCTLDSVSEEPSTCIQSKEGTRCCTMIKLNCGSHGFYVVTREAFLAAVKMEPEIMLRSVDLSPFLSLALAAVEHPDAYNYLSEDLKRNPCILYTALECDSALRAEFLSTASKSEIKQWQWHMQQKRRKKN
mmetsp:Transcript_81177/g.143789  ORF Transcript_81177/g.143789 Transcript_81177/m.143789 type:complete len:446 (+) Transcript_81177:56-1393(+)